MALLGPEQLLARSIDVVLLDIQLAGGAEGLRLLGMLVERAGGRSAGPAVVMVSGSTSRRSSAPRSSVEPPDTSSRRPSSTRSWPRSGSSRREGPRSRPRPCGRFGRLRDDRRTARSRSSAWSARVPRMPKLPARSTCPRRPSRVTSGACSIATVCSRGPSWPSSPCARGGCPGRSRSRETRDDPEAVCPVCRGDDGDRPRGRRLGAGRRSPRPSRISCRSSWPGLACASLD